jgi:AcrR family transcriptional regulator
MTVDSQIRFSMQNTRKKMANGRSITSKGMATRAAILDSSHEVFKDTGYYGASVSEITRRCNVSMGTFYQYFKNKEQVFMELNDLIISRFTERIEALSLDDLDFKKRLEEMIRLLYLHSQENFAFHSILGESELIDQVTIGYYETIARHFRSFFRLEAQNGHLLPLDPNMIAYGLIGICYFNSLKWDDGAPPYSSGQIVKYIEDLCLYGIGGKAPWQKPPHYDHLTVPDPAPLFQDRAQTFTKGEKTRQTIFNAAEKIIGQYGINHANIADITREAGVAQGTFYIHFDSKIALIEGFVRYINHLLRKELQRRVAGLEDRRDVEWTGMLAFLNFLSKHRAIYRVIPEFELVGREAGLWYYKKLAKGYISGLKEGIAKGQIRDLPAKFMARFLMGFIHFIALKWLVWNNTAQTTLPDQVLRDLREFILFGLSTQPE